TIIENSSELLEQFQSFEQSNQKSILIIVIDGRIGQQQLNYKLCFPSIFLHDWDYWFVDTSTSGSAFHLQKKLQIFTSKIEKSHQKESINDYLYDLNILFDDCLWDFCSRLQINVHKLSQNLFHNSYVYEFYQRQTTTYRRVQCLKNIFQQMNQLQKQIITIYHENISMNEESLRKNCNSFYDISKDTLCGKHFTSLVDSLQSHIRISFTNFVSYIFNILLMITHVVDNGKVAAL
ncbi:unnamed protein product, partial [Rotaria sp. Silwood1]